MAGSALRIHEDAARKRGLRAPPRSVYDEKKNARPRNTHARIGRPLPGLSCFGEVNLDMTLSSRVSVSVLCGVEET